VFYSITSETVAERFGISRQQQDEFALQSHAKSANVSELSVNFATNQTTVDAVSVHIAQSADFSKSV
jgi:acetyl-CoA acetyltransferase